MVREKIWALVSDGVRARILCGLESESPGETVELVSTSGARHLREIVSDRAGRSFSSGSGGRRSALEPGSDPIRRDMQDFARETLGTLERRYGAGAFDRLAILAEPRMLGILRQEMPEALRPALIEEQAINLIGLPARELRRAVRRCIGLDQR